MTSDTKRREWVRHAPSSPFSGTNGRLEEMLDQLASLERERAAHQCLQWCESPIEAMIVVQLRMMGWDFPGQTDFNHILDKLQRTAGVKTYSGLLSAPTGSNSDFAAIQLSVALGDVKARIDLAVFGIGSCPVRLAIEADGHDFHERTKEQATRDKGRDRALTTAGWHCLRFTGSEIFADTAAVHAQIESAICAIEVDRLDLVAP